MSTLTSLVERHGIDVLDHLDREALVPVLNGLQAQGDIIVVPAVVANRPAITDAQTPIPQTGVPVVRGENGGNTHLLLAEGDVRFDASAPRDGDLQLGTLTVAEGATAYLAHPEHGYAGIAPGTYIIRRQREQADEIRLVQD